MGLCVSYSTESTVECVTHRNGARLLAKTAFANQQPSLTALYFLSTRAAGEMQKTPVFSEGGFQIQQMACSVDSVTLSILNLGTRDRRGMAAKRLYFREGGFQVEQMLFQQMACLVDSVTLFILNSGTRVTGGMAAKRLYFREGRDFRSSRWDFV